MADPQIITTLTAKRNELEARIASYEAEIERLRQSIVAINGTLAIFSTTGECPSGGAWWCGIFESEAII